MDRKQFIKKSVITGVVGTLVPKIFGAKKAEQTEVKEDKLMQRVGFNHLPNNLRSVILYRFRIS
jgi:hypothetical protein